MTDPTDAVQSRQPEPSDGSNFVRTFVIHARGVADDILRDIGHPFHDWNKLEVVRDAIRRGLRAVGDVVVTHAEQRADGTGAVTYSVPVAATENAAAVSSPPEVPVPPPVTVPEPELTVDPEPTAVDQSQ